MPATYTLYHLQDTSDFVSFSYMFLLQRLLVMLLDLLALFTLPNHDISVKEPAPLWVYFMFFEIKINYCYFPSNFQFPNILCMLE